MECCTFLTQISQSGNYRALRARLVVAQEQRFDQIAKCLQYYRWVVF
jgi:hypothetical protein